MARHHRRKWITEAEIASPVRVRRRKPQAAPHIAPRLMIACVRGRAAPLAGNPADPARPESTARKPPYADHRPPRPAATPAGAQTRSARSRRSTSDHPPQSLRHADDVAAPTPTDRTDPPPFQLPAGRPPIESIPDRHGLPIHRLRPAQTEEMPPIRHKFLDPHAFQVRRRPPQPCKDHKAPPERHGGGRAALSSFTRRSADAASPHRPARPLGSDRSNTRPQRSRCRRSRSG